MTSRRDDDQYLAFLDDILRPHQQFRDAARHRALQWNLHLHLFENDQHIALGDLIGLDTTLHVQRDLLALRLEQSKDQDSTSEEA